MRFEDLKDLNAYQLAGMAECQCPDSLESPGAALLLSVAAAVADRWQELADMGEDERRDVAAEIADQAPSIYTHRRWVEFVDVCAYQEDLEEFGPIEDMEKAAGLALYLICERLAVALLEGIDEDEDEGEA